MYVVGIDLGTTYTAAAVWRDGVTEIATLGEQTAAIPSVVLRREDGTFLVGEAATRRGLTAPDRVAREFKRRLGDPTPILLGGAPHSAELLTAQLLRATVDRVAAVAGGPPARLCLSHPANWGPYKTDLLRQAARLADVDIPVTLTTEPEAAAVSYAHSQRLASGATVAVYDLGGGTFDAAVLRQTAEGFELLGQPEGVEHLGGIDFDAAVFDHVRRALGDRLNELDEDDPTVLTAVSRLRDECVRAREALSSDTDAAVPVLLPGVATEVRLTRAELETMIRPALTGTVEALQRALRSAGVVPEQLASVLLVGGASRTPIVAQLVGAEFDRPVAVDAHPKHAIALGAAHLAARQLPGRRSPLAPGRTPGPPPATGKAPVPVSPAEPVTAPLPTTSDPAAAAPISPARMPVTGKAAVPARPDLPPDDAPPLAAKRRPRRWLLVVAGAVLLILLGTAGVAAALRDTSEPLPTLPSSSPSPRTSPTPSPSPSPSPTPSEQASPAVDPPAYSAPPPPPPPPSPSTAPAATPSTVEATTGSTVTVPELLYLACEDAVVELAAYGLVGETVAHSDELPVLAQDPAAGTRVPVGSTVWLTCGYP